MVSKRNRNRKTAEKIAKPAEKPAEKIAKPAEINVDQILTAVTKKVVEVLKPDLEQKVTAVQTALSNQIKAEMQDLREHLPSLPQQPVEQPDQPEGETSSRHYREFAVKWIGRESVIMWLTSNQILFEIISYAILPEEEEAIEHTLDRDDFPPNHLN